MRNRINRVLVVAMSIFAWSSVALASPPEKKKAVEKLGEQVSRGVIQEGLETFDEPENQARMGRILNSPEMRAAARDLSASLVLGVFDGIRSARQTGAPDQRELAKAIGQGIDRQVTPALGRLANRVIDSALDAALTDEHIARIEILGEASTHAAIRGLAQGIEDELGPALAATLDKDIGPALALVMERDLLPAIGRGLDTPEMQAVVANLTRSFATEFIGGAGDAIDVKAESNAAEGKENGLQLFGNKVAFGYSIALFVAFALGTMAVVLSVVLLRYSRRLRKQSEAATEREAALLHLIENLKSNTPELKVDVRQLLEDQLIVE
ncbi:hypothetical protein ACNOYE_30055 [Nannocystaceae bacterium ST9]